MKWLTNLFRPNPAKMTPYGRQVLAEMNIHPGDWGLSPGAATHVELGRFLWLPLRGFQREPPTYGTQRTDYRKLNRHDRLAFGQRHATMLASEIPPQEVKREAQQTMAAAAVPAPRPVTATEMMARQQMQMTELNKLVSACESEINRLMQIGDLRKANEIRALMHRNLQMAASPPVQVSLEQAKNEFGLKASYL